MRLVKFSLLLSLFVNICCTAQHTAPAVVAQASSLQPVETPPLSPSPVAAMTPNEMLQQVSAQKNQTAISPPLVPFIVGYEFVPHYFMQAINNDSQYARIEAALYEAKTPIYNLVLTEKNGRRVNYTNSEEKAAALKRAGAEARVARIDYRSASKFGQLPAHEFGFTDERGQPVRWRFSLAAPASERGAGMTPQEAGGSGWLLIYRDAGSAAGEGTAVEIGGRTSEAEAWEEISSPPFFVAYRGVYAEGLNTGIFSAGQETWRTESTPDKLQEGTQWKLIDERGRTRQLRITSLRGDEATIDEVIASPSPFASALSIKARRTAQGFALRSVTVKNNNKSMRVSFAPELDMTLPGNVAFQIDQNDHNKILHGSVTVESRNGAAQLRWQPKSPDWAKSRVINSAVNISADGYKIEAR
jgi:hypothetical protein